MNNFLLILNQIFENGLTYATVNAIITISILCAILVIISKNPIVSIFLLITLFFNISCYLMMLGFNFIALAYLLVYVGAVSILFLFTLMLLNVRISELVSDNSNTWPLAVLIGLIYVGVLVLPLYYLENIISAFEFLRWYLYSAHFRINFSLAYDTLKMDYENFILIYSYIWDGVLNYTSHIINIGKTIYTIYPIFLILTSIILLLAMIGAIVITMRKK